jgi:hypothetical protein
VRGKLFGMNATNNKEALLKEKQDGLALPHYRKRRIV